LPGIIHNEAVVLISHISLCASLVLLTVLFAWLKRGADLAQYFALKPIPVKDIVLWVGIALFVKAVRILLCLYFDLTLMPGTAGNFSAGSEVVRYALALPLLGSTAYTLLFQGFLFAGFQSSRIGIPGTFVLLAAIYLLPSIAFGGPYETLLDAIDVFLLTLARWRTKSLYPTLGMAILSNELEAATVILFNLPSA
ncbi:MAG: hypothetical protein IT364_22590, partial [Candidatus Hydrogenedentes bacterium]|nr:hypothetical protein [Candidatus Hydrogenedentota bacterium]